MDQKHEVEDDKPLDPVESNVDVLHITQKRPYRDVNFIGTYLAVCLGALASYGGFVMPATSLLLINEDIGEVNLEPANQPTLKFQRQVPL